MVAPGEMSTTTTLLCPNPTLRLQSQDTEKENGRKLEKQNFFKQEQPMGKVVVSESRQHVFAHGLHRLQRFSSDSPVRFMMYSEAAAAFISLHSDNTACLYKADGHKQTFEAHLPFMGLTATKLSECLVGWGPGPVLSLLDSDLRPLDAAGDALDIRVCQAAEHSTELVTAGVGNVCVWSVVLMRCKVKIQEELQHNTFTHMALAPPRSDRPHRAFVVCGQVVTVVDLDGGRVLEHKKDLCLSDITAVAYCFHLDYLVTASQELSITVWGPDWEPRVTFLGHSGVVNSLFYCSELSMLISSSVDCTIRCWNVDECDAVECVHTDEKNPPLHVGGTRGGDVFFSFSQQGVDFWTIRSLYTLHCQIREDEGTSLRKILVSPFPAPYPTRLLCVSGDSDITLVAAETGAVLTSFKAETRILCADYCLHKEILLALTEEGTVLQANTLTNPITLMQEWKGRGQGPWQQMAHLTESDAQNLSTPGPACCLALYTYVVETERALEEWRGLQDRRGCSHRSKAALDDVKNKFLIILGQSGGCVSVLKMNNGSVLFRTPAHNGQRVTTVQVYPENRYLLTTGEDLTVVIWKVNPFVRECLTQQQSVHCGQPQVYLAALGPQLALTSEDPSNSSYSVKLFNLINHSQTDHQLKEGHLDHFTGLCVFPDLKVFVSSSLDKTVRIWNEENHLIRTLQLNTVPQCIGFSGFGGELFLGIKGDLCKMNCLMFLPRNYQQTLSDTYCEPLPDLPIPKNKESQIKTSSTSIDEEKVLKAITSNQILTEEILQQKEISVISNMDLQALLQGTVKCKKGKPPSTKQTKIEAFGRYMNIIYGLPHNIKIDFDLEDTFDPTEFLFCPKPNDFRPRNPPRVKDDVHPQPKLNFPVIEEKKKEEKAPAATKTVKPQPVKKIVPKKRIIVEKVKEPPKSISFPKKPTRVEKEEKPPKIISPKKQQKPKTPTPPRCRPRTPTPPPPRETSPEVQTFLKQFAEMRWFHELYPDKKSIPNTMSAEDFALQWLNHLQTCSIPTRVKILAAIQALHNQGLLQNTDQLYQGLIDCVRKFARPKMSPVEWTALVETLNLLMRLKSPGSDLVTKLLTLLAYKKLGLRDTVMPMLRALGVDEAEQWLWPELESWDSELQDQSDPWNRLHGRADCWLELWISKYKRAAVLKPSAVCMVDVLNYFCSVQKEEHRKARYVAPARHNNTVLLPLYDRSSQPILRLGEMYTTSRIRRPPGLILPPLRSRPFLMHIPNFISFPLPRITLRPFHVYSDEDWLKASTPRYFIQQQSCVEYYR